MQADTTAAPKTGRLDPMRRVRMTGLGVWLVGLLLSALAALQQDRKNQELTSARFTEEAAQLAEGLLERMHRFEYGLRGARGAVIAVGAEKLSRRAFRHYAWSRDIGVEFPGVHGFGVVRRVPLDAQDAFVQAARQDDWLSFDVQQVTPHQGERWVITFIEPVATNREAVGLDIASEPRRRAAAAQAMRTGQATLTAPLTLVQAPLAVDESFLLLLPVYQPELAIGTPDERTRACQGFTYASVITAEVFRGLVGPDAPLTFSLSDLDEGADHTFYRAPAAHAGADGLRARLSRALFGRVWQIDVQTRAPFFVQLRLVSAQVVLALGALTSSLLAGLVYAYGLSRQRARQVRTEQAQQSLLIKGELEAQVGERTEQLETARRDLQTVLDALPSMIGYCDKHFVNQFGNLAYRRWFGAEHGTLSGRHVRDLIGAEAFERNRPVYEAALRGEPQASSAGSNAPMASSRGTSWCT
jgi:CHASE1-domain containing sensor protein